MITLQKEYDDGNKTWLIRHTKTVLRQDGWKTDSETGEPILDEDGNKIPLMVEVEEDIHKPQYYTAPPNTTEIEVQAFADIVLENHKAGRSLTYEEPTEAELIYEAKNKKRYQIETEAQRRVDAIVPPKRRERLQVIGIKIAHSRGTGKPVNKEREDELVAIADEIEAIDNAEQAALAEIENLTGNYTVSDIEAIEPNWP